MLNQAYTIANLEEQLALNTRNFFANPGNFEYDVANRQFKVSKILEWYGSDFGADQATQLKALAPYLPNRQAYDAAISNAVNVTYQEYSWALNEYVPAAGSGMTNGSGMKHAGSGMKEAGSGMKEMQEAGSGSR